MDPFHQMAARVAEGGDGKGKKEKKDRGLEEFEPRWQKARSVLETKVKPTVKDLDQAIKDEDEKLTGFLFERMMELMISLANTFQMREFTTKLKTLEQKTFD